MPVPDVPPGRITGQSLVDRGYAPSAWFAKAIEAGERIRQAGGSEAEIVAAIEALRPPAALPLR